VHCFSLRNTLDQEEHFLAVGNDPKPGISDPQLYVPIYRFDSADKIFVHDHTISSNNIFSSSGLYVSSLTFFQTENTNVTAAGARVRSWLVVANKRDDTGNTTVPTFVFEWDIEGSRNLLGDGTDVLGTGFRWSFNLETIAVSDVEFFESGVHRLLLLANSQGTDTPNTEYWKGTVDVFEFNNGAPTLRQAIPSLGVSDIEIFEVSGEGTFVAVANRQLRAPAVQSGQDGSVYDQISKIYKWSPVDGLFVEYQNLTNFTTVLGDGTSVDGLRGVTGFKAFTSEGETYLAVAQSVCESKGLEDDVSQTLCDADNLPKSSVLQWNRLEKRFDDLLSITDTANLDARGEIVPDSELTVHQFSFRIRAGMARRWFYLFVEEIQFLMVCSLTQGLVVYEWDFEHVVGLDGVSSVLAYHRDPSQQEQLFAASTSDAALVSMKRAPQSTCPTAHANVDCLVYIGAVSEEPLRASRLKESFALNRPAGLAGVKFLSASDGIINVNSGLLRDEMRCSSIPPVDPEGNAGVLLAPECQDIEIQTTFLSGTFGLFAIEPFINGEGTLVFEPDPRLHGRAEYSVTMQDSGSNAGGNIREASSKRFAIEIVPVNQRPVFTIADDIAVIEGTGAQENIFATDIRPGETNDEFGQMLTFTFEYDNEHLFVRPPTVHLDDVNGIGTIFYEVPSGAEGEAHFSFTLVDDGPMISARGDQNQSHAQSLSIIIGKRDRPPFFLILKPNVEVMANSGKHSVNDFIGNISVGQFFEQGQDYTFTLTAVRVVSGLELEQSLFQRFEIQQNGTLVFEVTDGPIGIFSLNVTMVDTGEAGYNSRSSSFVFTVFPRLPVFQLVANQQPVELLELDTTTDYSFPGLFALPSGGMQFEFSLRNITNLNLFVGLPTIARETGSLGFTIPMHQAGRANLTVDLRYLDSLCMTAFDEQMCSLTTHTTLTIRVVNVNSAPQFQLPEFVSSLESAGTQEIPRFVYNIVGGATADEAWQSVEFSLSYTSSIPDFFSIPPVIDRLSSLTYRSATGAHGVATVSVVATDNGGLRIGENATSTPKIFVIKVYPLPRVGVVIPRVGPASGGNLVTVRGQYFGSKYSRGYVSDLYEGINVYIGSSRCSSEQYVSDTEIHCVMPSGLGKSTVSVNISDGHLTRSGYLDAGYTHTLFYMGGTLAGATTGFIGLGPAATPADLSQPTTASLQLADVSISKTVRAILPSVSGNVYVGGDFEGVDSDGANNVFAWDGSAVNGMGNGVDGAVYTLATFREVLIVGGAFTHAQQARYYAESLSTGGLASWDGQTWSLVGGVAVDGVVTALAVDNGVLYVGGRLRGIGSLAVQGVAMFDGSSWTPLGSGVTAGGVNAIATSGDDVFVGGDFTRAGDVRCSRLARFNGTQWFAVGDINGEVRSIAAADGRVFIGGDFTQINGRDMLHIAVLRSGQWVPLAAGVNGRVYALGFVGDCLYLGGSFTALGKGDTAEPALYAARYCEGLTGGTRVDRLEGLSSFTGIGPVRSVSAARFD